MFYGLYRLFPICVIVLVLWISTQIIMVHPTDNDRKTVWRWLRRSQRSTSTVFTCLFILQCWKGVAHAVRPIICFMERRYLVRQKLEAWGLWIGDVSRVCLKDRILVETLAVCSFHRLRLSGLTLSFNILLSKKSLQSDTSLFFTLISALDLEENPPSLDRITSIIWTISWSSMMALRVNALITMLSKRSGYRHALSTR